MFKPLSVDVFGDIVLFGNKLSVILGVVGGMIVSFLGGWDRLIITLVTLIVIDYVTGVVKAIYEKKLSSALGYKGIIKKFVMLIIIGMSVALQTVLPPEIPLREITIMFFVCNEGLSILENCAKIIPIPERIKEVLIQLRSNTDKKTKKIITEQLQEDISKNIAENLAENLTENIAGTIIEKIEQNNQIENVSSKADVDKTS